MRKTIGVILSILMIFTLISCGSSNSNGNEIGTKADDLSIVPGETKFQDILDKGYTYKWSEIATPTDKLDGKTFITPWIDIIKDGEKYATIGLINKASESLKIEECVVGDTTIYTNGKGHHKFSEVTVKGENYVGMSFEDIKGKFKDKLTHEDERSLVYDDGKFSYDFEFDEQKVLSSVTFDINEHNM